MSAENGEMFELEPGMRVLFRSCGQYVTGRLIASHRRWMRRGWVVEFGEIGLDGTHRRVGGWTSLRSIACIADLPPTPTGEGAGAPDLSGLRLNESPYRPIPNPRDVDLRRSASNVSKMVNPYKQAAAIRAQQSNPPTPAGEGETNHE